MSSVAKKNVIRCNALIVALMKDCNLTLSVQSQCHTIISCELEVSAVIGFSWISMAHPLHRVESGRNKSARALATTAIRPFSSHPRKTRLWAKGWIKGHVVKLCSLRKLPATPQTTTASMFSPTFIQQKSLVTYGTANGGLTRPHGWRSIVICSR